MNKRFEALDAFRGICAISVVILHMHWINSITELQFFRSSYIFVEFFFVLSGFVLAHGYGFRGGITFKKFMTARFFRLYPLHLFMLLLVVFFQILKILAYKYTGLSFSVEPFTGSYSLNELIPNLLLIQSWSSYTLPTSFNSPSWSISIEFYIYAIFFLTISTFKYKQMICWMLISILSFILIISESDILVSQVLRGLSCFFGGAFTYFIYKNISHLKPSYIIGSIVETFLLLGIVLTVQSNINFLSVISSVLFLFTVLFFSFESGVFSKILKIRVLQYTGKLSYSIYMTHSVVFLFLGALLKVVDSVTDLKIRTITDNVEYMNFGNSLVNNIAVIIILCIVVYISSLTHKHIEIRFKK